MVIHNIVLLATLSAHVPKNPEILGFGIFLCNLLRTLKKNGVPLLPRKL